MAGWLRRKGTPGVVIVEVSLPRHQSTHPCRCASDGDEIETQKNETNGGKLLRWVSRWVWDRLLLLVLLSKLCFWQIKGPIHNFYTFPSYLISLLFSYALGESRSCGSRWLGFPKNPVTIDGQIISLRVYLPIQPKTTLFSSCVGVGEAPRENPRALQLENLCRRRERFPSSRSNIDEWRLERTRCGWAWMDGL